MDTELPLPYETPEAPQGEQPLGQPSQPATQGQSGVPQPAAGGQPVPNLDDIPQFRTWKSQTDSRLAAAELRAQQAEMARSATAAEIERIRTASMDEPERIVYERNRIAQEANALRSELATVRYEQQLRADVDEMAAKLNVPTHELLGAFTPQDDPHTRWLKALDLQQKRVGQAKPVPQQNQEPALPYQYPSNQGTYQQPYQQPYQSPAQNPANRVDTGVGQGNGVNRYQASYERALENNDISSVIDIEAAATAAGVVIRRKTG